MAKSRDRRPDRMPRNLSRRLRRHQARKAPDKDDMSAIVELVEEGKSLASEILREDAVLSADDVVTNLARRQTSLLAKVEASGLGDLVSQKADALEAEKNYSEGAEKNQLTREAQYPKDRTKIFGTVALVLVGESCLNAYFYARELASPLYALPWATFATALLAGGGFFTSEFYRFWWVPPWWKRILFGGVVAGLFAAFGLLSQFVAAHLRDRFEESQGGVKTLSRGLFEEIIADPFGYSDTSILMLFFGVLAFVFVTWELFHADDKVPGYGALHRKMRDAWRAYEGERVAINNVVVAIFEDTANEGEEMVWAARKASTRVVELLRSDLSKLGIADPYGFEASAEPVPAVLGLVEEFKGYSAARDRLFDLGDVRTLLAEGGADAPMGDVEGSDRLSECRTAEQALAWLDENA